jgi:hypothetical protein
MTDNTAPSGGPAGPPSGIVLEPFSPENADLVLSWRNDPVVRANSLSDGIIDKAAHLAFVENLPTRPGLHYALVRLEGQPQAVLNLDLGQAEAYWGCYLAPSTAPRPGLFPLLVLLAGHLAFVRQGAASLCSDVLTHNLAPQKMNGFLGIAEAGRRQMNRADGQMVEVIAYRLAQADFARVQQKAARLLTRRMLELFTDFAAQTCGDDRRPGLRPDQGPDQGAGPA